MSAEQADHYLIEEIRGGSEAGWRQLIDRYQGRLQAFAKSRIASIADAEDVVQDTFIGFLQSLSRYDAARSLETYLFTILRYKITDYLRASGSGFRKLETQADDWWEEATPSLAESPSMAAVKAESAEAQQALLATVLRQLIQDLRDRGAFEDLQIIELLFYACRRNKLVAELLEVDEKHVAGVKYRAIQKIQKYLSEIEAAAVSAMTEVQADANVSSVWRQQRVTCLKRSTLGQYLLGILEDPWLSYTQFHLDVVGCPLCVANLEDLETEDEGVDLNASSGQIFASSVGFLSRVSQPGSESSP
ncbi:MAG: sigma-70 family RNA polymerase sigma factor [Planctomycetes bacterium]|nr:sigma-70 family RNA polymerase sigma factor [Planctomycetota bacterium]